MLAISPAKSKRAVLFDLDGVLISSFRFWFHLFNETLKGFGHNRITIGTFRKHWGQSTEEDIRIFMPERNLREVKNAFYSTLGKFGGYLKINKEAEAVLQQLRGCGFKLACVTNSHRRIALWQLRFSRLGRFFTVVVTADDVKKAKPDPEMLVVACRRMRLTPEQVIFVGDTRTDVKAAKNAGCVFIGYRMPAQYRYRIRSLNELFPLIRLIFHEEEEKC